MFIQVNCPKCQTAHKVDREHEGKGLRCKQCKAVFRIESPSEEPPPRRAMAAPKAVDDRTRSPREDETQSQRDSTRRRPESVPAKRAARRDEEEESEPKKKGSALPYVLMGCGGFLLLVVGGVAVGGYLLYRSATKAARDFASELEKKGNEVVREIEKGPAHRLAAKAWPDSGQTVRIVRTEKLEGSRPLVREEVFTRTVRESGSPRPRKFEDSYEKAVVTGTPPRSLSFHGRKITFELSGNQYRATVAPGNTVAEADLTALASRLGSSDAHLLPDKPMQVGATWTVDAARVCSRLLTGTRIASNGSPVEVKLERIEQRQGKDIAILSANLKLQLEKTDDRPDAGAGSLTGTGTWEVPLDGSSRATLWTFRGDLQSAGAAKAAYTVREEQSEQVPAKPDPEPKPETPPKTPSEPTWQNYTSDRGQFSCQFPGRPRATSTSSSKTNTGKVETGDAKATLFSVTWRDYGKTPSGKAPASLLDLASKTVAKGDPVTKKPIVYGEHSGVELTVKGPGGTTVERAYAVKSMLYRVSVRSTPESVPTAALVARFLDSFELTGVAKDTKPGPSNEGKPAEPKLLATLGRESWPSGSSAVFSRDGKTMYAKVAGELVIYDVESGKSAPAVTLFGRSDRFAVEATGKMLVQSSGNKSIDFIEIANPKFPKRKIEVPANVWALALSSDDKVLATTTQKKINLWDFATGKPLKALEKHDSIVWTIDYSPDGKLFASIDAARNLILWDATTYEEVGRLEGDAKPAASVSGDGVLRFSPDSKTLIGPGTDQKSVIIWDVAQKKLLREFVCPHKINNSTVSYRFETPAVSPDSKTLAVSSYDGLVYPVMFYEIATGKQTGSFVPKSQGINRLTFSPDGKLLAVSTNSGQVQLYQLK